MKVAVVHDYFTQMGGAEKVAEELYDTLPGSDLFSTVALQNMLPGSLRDVEIHTSWMQHLPLMSKFYREYFFLYPFAVQSLRLDDYDLVVSSSSGYVKGVRTNLDAIHVCYCHTPMRWVWSFDQYSSRESFGTGVQSLLPGIIRMLRRWDTEAARQPDHFIANSQSVAERIWKAYGRASEVIFPPIDTERFRPSQKQDDYYVILSRLVGYKRADVAIEAFTRLNKRLVVIGGGPARAALQAKAGPTVEFLGRVPDDVVERYVSECRALIFPGEEDFGMAPLEVAAAGRPTIAYRAGGAIETIIEDETGLFFNEQTSESVMDAVLRFEQGHWDQERIRLHSEKFDRATFRRNFHAFLARVGAPVSEN